MQLLTGNQRAADTVEPTSFADALLARDGSPGSEYSEYIGHLRGLASGAVMDIKEKVQQCVFKNEVDRIYVLRLIDGGEYQLMAPASNRWADIEQAQILRDALIEGIKFLSREARRRKSRPGSAFMVKTRGTILEGLPATMTGLKLALNEIEKLLGRLLQAEQQAIREGTRYSSKPFFEFLALPEEERRGKSFSHLLPVELRRAETVMSGFVSSDAPWQRHNQAVGAQLIAGMESGFTAGELADLRGSRSRRGGRMQRPGEGELS